MAHGGPHRGPKWRINLNKRLKVLEPSPCSFWSPSRRSVPGTSSTGCGGRTVRMTNGPVGRLPGCRGCSDPNRCSRRCWPVAGVRRIASPWCPGGTKGQRNKPHRPVAGFAAGAIAHQGGVDRRVLERDPAAWPGRGTGGCRGPRRCRTAGSAHRSWSVDRVARLARAVGTEQHQRVDAWAGPWLLDERWWSARRPPSARVQIVTEGGIAMLMRFAPDGWHVEGVYD